MTYRQYRVTIGGVVQVTTEDGKFVDAEPQEDDGE